MDYHERMRGLSEDRDLPHYKLKKYSKDIII